MPAVKDGFSIRTTNFEHLTFFWSFSKSLKTDTQWCLSTTACCKSSAVVERKQIVFISTGPFFECPSCRQSGANHFFCSVWLVRKANEYMQTSMIHNHQHGSEPIFQLDLSHAGLSFSFRHAGVGLPGKMFWLLVLVQFGSLGRWWVSQK